MTPTPTETLLPTVEPTSTPTPTPSETPDTLYEEVVYDTPRIIIGTKTTQRNVRNSRRRYF